MKNEKLSKKQLLSYFTQALIMLACIVLIAYGSYLSNVYMVIIVIFAITVIPFVIKAWIKQKRSFVKFDQLCNYLTNIIPIFLQKTKVRFVLGELYEICEGEIKNVILEAIEYIDNTKDDPELIKNGLRIIEKKFNNSRLESIHKFMLTVENTNSKTHKDIAENLNNDIEEWIKRTYSFQKDLKNRQTKILLLCIATLVMNVLFVYVYVSNDYFKGFINNDYYQLSTFIFIIFVLMIISIIVIKLNGEWLINDVKTINEERNKDKYRYYKSGKRKLNYIDFIFVLLIVITIVYFIYIGNKYVCCYLLLILSLLLTKNTRKFEIAKRHIKKQFTIEFPIWLREVSLSLGNYTVLNAIENSLTSVSYGLRRELRTFLNEAKKDPTSIKHYNDFLKEYKIDEVRSSMRVLYAVNSDTKLEMKERVAKLISRNQELLAKSEALRNYDSIGGIEAIGYLPTIIFSIHMMISMVIMFYYMLEKLKGNI